jgi:hypothetical protein
MPLLRYDDHSPEDLDTEGEDHIADETRYFCMARPIKPQRPAAEDDYYLTAFAQALDIPRSALGRQADQPKMEILDTELEEL